MIIFKDIREVIFVKQHIDTIPVWDAYKTDCECPLCAIFKKNEEEYVDNFLGASVMEPDRRIEVNDKGFCHKHFKLMFDAGNRLGLALMTDTYMKETIKKLAANAKTAAEAAQGEAKKPALMRLGKKNPDLQGAAAEVIELSQRCIMCERLDTAMERYIYTLLYMWKHESEFKKAFAASKGMCIGHYAKTLSMAQDHLSGKDLAEFVDVLTKMELENLDRVEKDLEWFTLKFDYRNKDKPWGNSQDAVERSVNKVRGGAV